MTSRQLPQVKNIVRCLGYFTQVILCNKSKGRELIGRESLRISKVLYIEYVVLVRSSNLIFMLFLVISYIQAAYIDKAHHIGTNHVFNALVPSSVQAFLGVIKSAVRHGFWLQGSYLVTRKNNMGNQKINLILAVVCVPEIKVQKG